MKKRKKVKIILISIFSVAIFIILFIIIQRLVMPTYMDDIPEGAMIAEYYEDKTEHDVLFIGDCEVYESFSPVTLWEKYGINSYIRGSSQQLMWQSYYLLEDSLRYETPKVVVLAIMSMQYNEPQNEAYNRMTIDGMKWSSSKIGMIKASMTEDEQFAEYAFPILRYHSRITELTSEDWEYLFKPKKPVTYNGYMLNCEIRPVDTIPEPRILPDYNFGPVAYEYLDKIVDLCDEKGIELVFVKAPSLYPHWYDEWEAQVDEYANEHNIKYYNFLELVDEIGIDFSTDTYDQGLHMNVYGAEKLSVYLGNELVNNYNIGNRWDEPELRKYWDEKIIEYNEEKKENEKQ